LATPTHIITRSPAVAEIADRTLYLLLIQTPSLLNTEATV